MVSVPAKQLGTLIKLQKVEIALGKHQAALEQVDRRVVALDASLNEFITAIESKQTRVKDLQQQYRAWESEVQDLTDSFIKRIDDALETKQEEIMQV